jgi:hypothetical protein
MTDFRALCEELVEELEVWIGYGDEADCADAHAVVDRARAALAEQPVGQSRRCIYNPVQIAECGGPCEQIGPEACDCGALWVSQDAEQPTPISVSERLQEVHPFVVRHYTNDARPSIKGNGFDGLEIGEDRQEAEEFIAWINKRICRTPEAQP